MNLIKHVTNEGTRYGVVTYRGRKWMKIHYVAHAKATRLKVEEERYMQDLGPMTAKQRRRYKESLARHAEK